MGELKYTKNERRRTLTNLEMLLAGTPKDMQMRSDLMVVHHLLANYYLTFFSGKDDLKKAWKLNDLSTNLLSVPGYVLAKC